MLEKLMISLLKLIHNLDIFKKFKIIIIILNFKKFITKLVLKHAKNLYKYKYFEFLIWYLGSIPKKKIIKWNW